MRNRIGIVFAIVYNMKILGFEFFDKGDHVMFVGPSGCMGDWGHFDMTFAEFMDFVLGHSDEEILDLIACNM